MGEPEILTMIARQYYFVVNWQCAYIDGLYLTKLSGKNMNPNSIYNVKNINPGPMLKIISIFRKIYFGLFLLLIIAGAIILFCTSSHKSMSVTSIFLWSLIIATGATIVALPQIVTFVKFNFNNSVFLKTLQFAVMFGMLVTVSCSLIINFINEYKPVTPVESAEAFVKDKYVNRSGRRGKKYIVSLDIWSSSVELPASLEFISEDIYDIVDVADVVILRIQKGRLGYYYAIQLEAKKNQRRVNV